MTVRLMPPSDGAHLAISVNGRNYNCAVGATIDVPDHDARIMLANGWTSVGAAVGATGARPTSPARGVTYHDTTLGKNVVFDGANWRDPATGGTV